MRFEVGETVTYWCPKDPTDTYCWGTVRQIKGGTVIISLDYITPGAAAKYDMPYNPNKAYQGEFHIDSEWLYYGCVRPEELIASFELEYVF